VVLETLAIGGVSPMESKKWSVGLLKKFFTEFGSGEANRDAFRGEMEKEGKNPRECNGMFAY